jgi:oxygen-independent coproporphyrinogen-3 oxidase
LRNNSKVYSINAQDAVKSVAYAQLRTKCAGYKPYYMYRQKNTVNNLENVGFAREGHEGLYNVFMMEEAQTVLGVGAGAVTKLVGGDKIVRIFNPKYPYEYLSHFEKNTSGVADLKTTKDKILSFYNITE